MVGKFVDLCNNCTYENGCMNRGTVDRPKLFCEQFELDVVEPAPREDRVSRDVPSDPGGDGEFHGLCCNCENRRHCTINEPEGHIWHCEEYC